MKRERERKKETFRRQRHHQSDVDDETSLSFSSLSSCLSLFSAFILALTTGSINIFWKCVWAPKSFFQPWRASQYCWVPKKQQKSFQASCSGPLRTARKQKITRISTLIGRPWARTPSSSTLAAVFSIAGAHPALWFFLSPFTVVLETWKPVLAVYTSQKQAKKKAHLVNEPWPSNIHAACCVAAHASLHHLRTFANHWLVTSIVALKFSRTPPPMSHSWKELFSFVLGTAAESPESPTQSYLPLPCRGDRRSIPVTGSAGMVRCLLLTANAANNKHHALAKSLSMFEASTQKTDWRRPTPFPSTNEVECMPATSLHDVLDSMHMQHTQPAADHGWPACDVIYSLIWVRLVSSTRRTSSPRRRSDGDKITQAGAESQAGRAWDRQSSVASHSHHLSRTNLLALPP